MNQKYIAVNIAYNTADTCKGYNGKRYF